VRPFGDGGRHRHLIEAALQGVGLDLAHGWRARDEQGRDGVQIGAHHGGERVGEPGPCGNDGDPDLAALRARIAVCSVAGRRLVARVDQADALIGAGHQKCIEVAAVECERVRDPKAGQRSRQQNAAAVSAHPSTPVKRTMSS
jgi:hypothetical protein